MISLLTGRIITAEIERIPAYDSVYGRDEAILPAITVRVRRPPHGFST